MEETSMSATPRQRRTLSRALSLIAGLALVAAALAWMQPGKAHAATTCTWAGTPAAPTGTFTVSPGVTNVPSAEPLRFKATGLLGGSCSGTMTFTGQLDAGATCPYSTFRGTVQGLPGVTRFLGHGSLLVPSELFDRAGNVVGVENANIMTQTNLARTTDCNTPSGFRGGWPAMFSSVVELYNNR
jgi:hypothetical protein